ncbi:hypothetical protein SNOG_10495 [Parastagonospora nodorum SN15]|uniref:Beta-lactamase-related domain-containing protein n=1 Tax=Phaeosphaeria nodorum (strain SN15 / ATCC MYA-4574 / FGSC 10173) TaxID=321614 RepID=Q0UCL9_PHANO|nr:hypothetical protein SNOG_10495 [Parastagonospora nodorum SN15]EAT81889.1 hypothetical protein SNOG_10495 [Parastagonospora nodorum SN15]
MGSLKTCLQDLSPSIAKILEIAGAAGASIGIVHQNETVHLPNFGHRDITTRLAPDENTQHHVASLSKSFTAAVLGILVHDQKLGFDQPVFSILKTFTNPDPAVHDRATYNYNNGGYNVATSLIEEVSGQSWGSFVTDSILKPLELDRTFVGVAVPEENYAHRYMPAPDETLTDVGRPTIANGTVKQGADVLGKGTTKKKLWYHNGSLVGFFSSVHVVPDTDTIVVILVNSIHKNDAPDWIGQLLVETILDCPDKNDDITLAKDSAKAYNDMCKQLEDEMTKDKRPCEHKLPLNQYVGRYYNKPMNWFIEVTFDQEALYFSFQGLAG